MDARSAAIALHGDVVGRDSILCPGPGHSPKDRSLSVKLTRDGPVVYSFAEDDRKSCEDHVMGRLGIKPARRMTQVVSSRLRRVSKDDDDRTASAVRIWKQTVALAGTLAERYLSNRKLKLPSYVEDVRFHPSCPFGKERLPCMVALYRDIVSNEPRAIHRTALTSDGHKIDRKALGPKGGCAIKLTPDAEVSTGLTIAEGIETALAGMALAFCPAWALGDAGSIERFPVLSGIECLTILADNDPTGQNAAIECSSRWTAEGREVFRVSSVRAGEDIADVWRTRAA